MRRDVIIIFMFVFSTQFMGGMLLSAQTDPAVYAPDLRTRIVPRGQKTNKLIRNSETSIDRPCFIQGIGRNEIYMLDTIPPELALIISSIGDSVLISVSSNENLYNGWLSDKLLHIFYSWPSYGLHTRLACDSNDKIHSTVASSGGNYYYLKMNSKGDILEEIPDWNGPHGHPILTDSSGKVIYIDQPTPSGEDGVVDNHNNSHMVRTDLAKIRYTKIDSAGNIVIDDIPIVINAGSWTGCARITCNTEDILYVIWSKGEKEICYVKSEDGGNTWSTTNSFGSVSWTQWHPEIITDDNDNIHIIWMDDRNYSGYNYELYYKKLYPNGMVSIDDTRLTDCGVVGYIMFPKFCMDSENHLYITWSDYYGSGPNWFTKIDGNLDKAGAPATNEEITIIEDAVIPQANNMECPVPVIDSWDNLHLIANSGYQPNTDKYLFYQKFAISPIVFVTFPNTTRYKIEMTGADTLWLGSFIASQNGDYFIEVSGSDTAGNIGYSDTIFQYTYITENSGSVIIGTELFTISPNPFKEMTTIKFQAPRTKSQITLRIYNTSGQLIKDFSLPTAYCLVPTIITWDGTDNCGHKAPCGVYFCRFSTGRYHLTKKILRVP